MVGAVMSLSHWTAHCPPASQPQPQSSPSLASLPGCTTLQLCGLILRPLLLKLATPLGISPKLFWFLTTCPPSEYWVFSLPVYLMVWYLKLLLLHLLQTEMTLSVHQVLHCMHPPNGDAWALESGCLGSNVNPPTCELYNLRQITWLC